MSTNNEELLKIIRYYQESLDKYSSNGNDYKLLGVIKKLRKLPIATSHLEDTGIGRTVNALRKLGGEVGDAAKGLVTTWKEMVVQEDVKKEDSDKGSTDNNLINKNETVSRTHEKENRYSDSKHKERERSSNRKSSDKDRSNLEKHHNTTSKSSHDKRDKKEKDFNKHTYDYNNIERSSSRSHSDSSSEVEEENYENKNSKSSENHRSDSEEDEETSSSDDEESSEREETVTTKNNASSRKSYETKSSSEDTKKHKHDKNSVERHTAKRKHHSSSSSESEEDDYARKHEKSENKGHRSDKSDGHQDKQKRDVGKSSSYKSSHHKRDNMDKENSSKKHKHDHGNSKSHSSKRKYSSSGSESEEENENQSSSRYRSDSEDEDKRHNSKKSKQVKSNSESEDNKKKHKSKSSKSDRHEEDKTKSREKTENKPHEKSSFRSDTSSKRDSEKHRSNRGTSDTEEAQEKSKSKHEKESNGKESKSHSGKHEKKDKRDREKEGSRDKHSHKRDDSKHEEKERISKEDKKESRKEKSSSSSSKGKDSAKSSSSKHKSSNEKSKKPETTTVKKIALGIDSESGASFAEALGMCGPVVFNKPTSSGKKKSTSTSLPSPEKPNKNAYVPSSSKTERAEVPVEKYVPSLLKEQPAEPLHINISSLLPEITPHYKPIAFPLDSQPKRLLTPDEALSQAISNKNIRTKVYSGNKTKGGEVESLFNICVKILQDNLDAIECTGGVPYLILKPILEKATPDQLFNLEHYNPYLIEETDELWRLHCSKEFRTKKREEMETWREMYMRCLDEREAKLNAITANIKESQDKSLPVRTTKLAYVDSIAKPPRNIARQQAKNGIVNRNPVKTMSSKLTTLATAGEASKISVPNPGSRAADRASTSGSSHSAIKPKKAPLMAKTLSLFKNRFKR